MAASDCFWKLKRPKTRPGPDFFLQTWAQSRVIPTVEVSARFSNVSLFISSFVILTVVLSLFCISTHALPWLAHASMSCIFPISHWIVLAIQAKKKRYKNPNKGKGRPREKETREEGSNNKDKRPTANKPSVVRWVRTSFCQVCRTEFIACYSFPWQLHWVRVHPVGGRPWVQERQPNVVWFHAEIKVRVIFNSLSCFRLFPILDQKPVKLIIDTTHANYLS